MRPAAVLLIVSAMLLVAAPALASRAPTTAESKGVRAAMAAFIAKKGSPAAKDNKVAKIRISSVDPTYASAETKSPTVGSAIAILHRKGTTWKVTLFGTGGFECVKDGPKKVLTELLGGCIPPSG